MGLVEKGWGSLEDARRYFRDSLSRYGPKGARKQKNEWLTRFSLSEVFMYEPDMRVETKEIVEAVIDELVNRKRMKGLKFSSIVLSLW